jgi:hypothetical protein
MAASQDAPEQGFRLRKFQGTQTEMDSTFIGPSFLVSSENWIPTQSYRLGKRPGSTVVQSLGHFTVTDLLAAHNAAGVLYLYAFCLASGSGFVQQMVEEGAPTVDPPRASFATGAAWGRMIQFRNRVYAGNGIDPLVSWVLGDPGGNTLTFHGIADLGPSPAATAIAATGLGIIPSGTYSYCWATYDTTQLIYAGRTEPATVNVGQNEALSFTPPAVPSAPQVLRLFVSPRNYPIETATMQLDTVTGTTAVTLSEVDVTDTRVPMAGGINVFRTGNMFVVWENRVVFAGMQSDPFSVFATDIILPGLEQQAFNLGTLFPDFAKVPLPAAVTGIGVCGVTSEFDPTAPLLFFTTSKTFIVAGDPFDPAGEAELIEVSSRVGCIGHDSIVATPVGTLWCGLDSVYLMPPGGGYPQDIGWPIADQIRAIPPAQRSTICATFNKQFYKLAIPVTGGTGNTAQWWLDLRGGGIGSVPSWWGPMTGFPVTALTADPDSRAEIDRCYAAVPGLSTPATFVLRTHQLNNYTDQIPDSVFPMPIRSLIRSGRFDADQPFLVKVVTRLRLIAQTAGLTYLHVALTTDGGVVWTLDPITLGQDMTPPGQFVHLTPTTPPPPPPNKAFNTLTQRGFATFGTISPAEAQTIAPYVRPRGLSVQIALTHDPALDAAVADPNFQPFFGAVELRDFEMLFIPSGRKVRFLNERISK